MHKPQEIEAIFFQIYFFSKANSAFRFKIIFQNIITILFPLQNTPFLLLKR